MYSTELPPPESHPDDWSTSALSPRAGAPCLVRFCGGLHSATGGPTSAIGEQVVPPSLQLRPSIRMTRAASGRILRFLVLLGYYASRGPPRPFPHPPSALNKVGGVGGTGVCRSPYGAHVTPARTEYTQPIAGRTPCDADGPSQEFRADGLRDTVTGSVEGTWDSTPTNWIGRFTGQGESRGAMQGARPSRTPLRGQAQAGLVDRIGSSHGRLPRMLVGRVADRPPALCSPIGAHAQHS